MNKEYLKNACEKHYAIANDLLYFRPSDCLRIGSRSETISDASRITGHDSRYEYYERGRGPQIGYDNLHSRIPRKGPP